MNVDDDQENNLLQELLSHQRPFVPISKKLYITDLKRIVNKLPHSIFSDECCIWRGYVTNLHNPKKSAYINFYFRKKKKALHRILFINFKDDLQDDEYIKFTCKHPGYCCSINCMRKYKYKFSSCDMNIPNVKNKTTEHPINFRIVFD